MKAEKSDKITKKNLIKIDNNNNLMYKQREDKESINNTIVNDYYYYNKANLQSIESNAKTVNYKPQLLPIINKEIKDYEKLSKEEIKKLICQKEKKIKIVKEVR